MLAIPFCLALSAPPLAFDDLDGLHSAVVTLGDVNGDGVPDFAFGHRPRPFNTGEKPTFAWPRVPREFVVWILSGSDGAVHQTLAGGPDFGVCLASVGDLDGDGVSDLATSDTLPGTPIYAAHDSSDLEEVDRSQGPRRVRIFSGASGAELATLLGEADVPGFGMALSGGLQLVGDPTPDLLIGGMGCAWLVDGASLTPAAAFRRDRDNRVQRLPPAGWTIPPLPPGVQPPAPRRGYVAAPFGLNVALVPDLDGDRLAEIVIGRPAQVVFSSYASAPPPLASDGWCVVGGPDLNCDGFGDVVATQVADWVRATSGVDGKLLWEIDFHGPFMRGEGTSLAFTSDHDGDGIRDLVVAGNETAWDTDTGSLGIISGRSGEALKHVGVDDFVPSQDPAQGHRPNSHVLGGLDVTPLGDLDGDGLDELVVQIPMLQELRVLRGSDLSTVWTLDVRG